jgi:hypothetical protein
MASKLKSTREKQDTTVVAVRFNDGELEILRHLAKRETDGNISELIRQAVLSFWPDEKGKPGKGKA